MKHLLYTIPYIPDLTLPRYQFLSAQNVQGVLQKHLDFLRQFHVCLSQYHLSMHLLYYYRPKKAVGEKLTAFLLFSGATAASLEAVQELLPSSPLAEYFPLHQPKAASGLDSPIFGGGATLIKMERKLRYTHSSVTKDFYTVPAWECNPDARMIDMNRALASIGESTGKPCAFRVDLYPAQLASDTHNALSPIVRTIKDLNTPVPSIQKQSYQSTQWDPQLESIRNDYTSWMENLDVNCHFRTNVYAFASEARHAISILGAAGAEAVSKGSFDILPLDLQGKGCLTSRMGDTPLDYSRVDSNDTPMSTQGCESWSTTFLLEEAAAYFRLPVLYPGENLDIPRESDPPAHANGIQLATNQWGRAVRYPLEYFCKHALCVGMCGSGKTNTMLHTASQLAKAKIPFLVLEPAKKEYRALFNDASIQDVLLFSPGAKTRFPLRVNPFQFPIGMPLSEYIDCLMKVFDSTFPIGGHSIHGYLDRAIQLAYEKYGWDLTSVNQGDKPYPMLEDVNTLMRHTLKNSTMSPEIKGNYEAFIDVHLDGLMKRHTGRVFNVPNSTIAPEDWLTTSAIIEMEDLSDDAKSFLTLLLCTWIQATLSTNQVRSRTLQHALFIEEAHNIIANTSDQPSIERVNPKISATALIEKMLFEVRGRGEGIIIADQTPSSLSPKIVKSTSLKIVHRLLSQDDREYIGTAMGANQIQMHQILSYSVGDALVSFEGLKLPFQARINQWSYSGQPADPYLPMPDDALHKHLSHLPVYAQTVVPFEKQEACRYQLHQIAKAGDLHVEILDILMSSPTNASSDSAAMFTSHVTDLTATTRQLRQLVLANLHFKGHNWYQSFCQKVNFFAKRLDKYTVSPLYNR